MQEKIDVKTRNKHTYIANNYLVKVLIQSDYLDEEQVAETSDGTLYANQ